MNTHTHAHAHWTDEPAPTLRDMAHDLASGVVMLAFIGAACAWLATLS